MITLLSFLVAIALLLVVGAAPFVGPFAVVVSLAALLLWGLWKASANLLAVTGENVLRLAQGSELFGRGGEDDPDFRLVPTRRGAGGGDGAFGPAPAAREGAARHERRAAYELPARLPPNHWALAGEWAMERENVVLEEAGGTIAIRFHARDAHLVLASGPEEPIRFRVLLDGEPPGSSHGVDVDGNGDGVLRQDRLYGLVREHGEVRERTLEITFLEPGAEAYAFTFG